jgi:hypothetical protein
MILLFYSIFIILHIIIFVIAFWLLPIIYLIFAIWWLINKLSILKVAKLSTYNLIIFGGKGKGKSNIMAFMVYLQRKTNPLSSIPFGFSEVLDPKTYFESIAPNDYKNMITADIKQVIKNEKWEGRTYFDDDTGIRFPSHEDTSLKLKYKSMSLFIPIQRHLYNSNTILNVQSIDRVWKILRELQVDGYIKAISVQGWKNFIWNSTPILKNLIRLKLRYYENHAAAESGMLPFEQTGLADKALDGLHMSQGRALKEIYESSNGTIKDIVVWVKKSHIKYDTRGFHKQFFGYSASASLEKK